VRFLFNALVVAVAGLIAGMNIDGTVGQLVALLSLCVLVNLAATLFATGIALRTRTVQAGPLMQIPIFLIIFMAPVYVPYDLLTGWVSTAASLNPATAILQAGRGFISGAPETTGLAFACAAALIALMVVYALRGLRKAEAGGG
jgi:ABC-2 type transport system permease protein